MKERVDGAPSALEYSAATAPVEWMRFRQSDNEAMVRGMLEINSRVSLASVWSFF